MPCTISLVACSYSAPDCTDTSPCVVQRMSSLGQLCVYAGGLLIVR